MPYYSGDLKRDPNLENYPHNRALRNFRGLQIARQPERVSYVVAKGLGVWFRFSAGPPALLSN